MIKKPVALVRCGQPSKTRAGGAGMMKGTASSAHTPFSMQSPVPMHSHDLEDGKKKTPFLETLPNTRLCSILHIKSAVRKPNGIIIRF